jgi:membrane associated rhomboid family serine protease
VLWTVGGLAVFWAFMVNVVPGGKRLFELLVFSPEMVARGQIWRLFTAGLLSPPGGPGSVTHVLFTLLGLYFLSPPLESRWGSARYVRFVVSAVVTGYTLAFLVDRIPLDVHFLHTNTALGVGAAVIAIAVAWSRENAGSVVRLFFFLPIKGAMLLWITIGFCVLNVIFDDPAMEGFIAPFGGVLVGVLFGGSPSPLRAAYLRWKLSSLQKKSGGLSAAAMLEPTPLKRPPPALRVIRGSADDDPPRREPPRDKRYLN